jgi:hypothetical protein
LNVLERGIKGSPRTPPRRGVLMSCHEQVIDAHADVFVKLARGCSSTCIAVEKVLIGKAVKSGIASGEVIAETPSNLQALL